MAEANRSCTGRRRWFAVDADGLRETVSRRDKTFVLYELIANAFDAPGTRNVAVRLARARGGKAAELSVEDDSPLGFTNLDSSFTLFAPSERRGEPLARGRFGIGEKIALALFDSAEIATTGWTVRFDARGRHVLRGERACGTRVSGTLRLSDDEIKDLIAAARRVLVPDGVRLTVNDEVVPYREPLKTIELTLPTELWDENGGLRRTRRKTKIHIHRPRDDEEATIYELGIPLVATGDRFSVDVQTKVPTNLDRDNVSPSYLAQLRAAVLEAMSDSLTSDDANAPWVRDAVERHGAAMRPDVIARVLDLRFGERRVAYDPQDREANARAFAAGYTVVYGPQMSAAEWEAAKMANAIVPAGKVTPSPNPDGDPGGAVRECLPRERWTAAMTAVVELSARLAPHLIGRPVSVRVVCDVTWPFRATYGSGVLTYNLGALGHKFFEGPLERILDLLIHELAHEAESNHLSESYYRALSALGGKLAVLALERPALFTRSCDAEQRRATPLKRRASASM